MMGAVLQTVNVRLSPEQIAYTINHAGASTLLVNDEFVELLESLKPQLPKVKTFLVMSDRPSPQMGSLSFVGEYEDLLAAASPDYDFPDFDENTQATTFYTTGTTGLPKGVYYSHDLEDKLVPPGIARRPSRNSITKTERRRSANLLKMPRGLMCTLRQGGRGCGGPHPSGSRRIDPS